MFFEIADDNTVCVPFAPGYLVDTDNLWLHFAGAIELFAHVFFIKLFDCFPVKAQLFGYILYRRASTSLANVESKPLRVKGILGKKRQSFPFHYLAPFTAYPTYFDVDVDSQIAARQVP